MLRSYGDDNLRNLLRSHDGMAMLFEGLVAKYKRFEIVVPTNFALVCFRVSPSAISKQKKTLDVYRNGDYFQSSKLPNSDCGRRHVCVVVHCR